MKNELEAFVDDLRSTHGRNLASVTLYGPGVSDGDSVSEGELSVLIVLHEIAPIDLRRAHACVREWTKLGHPVPVYFTVAELRDALDVFPIEFHAMERSRRVLFGEDLLQDSLISDHNLRHQVEYELRSKLMLLRREYIPATESPEGVVQLMADSLPTFGKLFGAVLLLLGTTPPLTTQAIIQTAAARMGLDVMCFEKVVNIRSGNFSGPRNESEANELFAAYMRQIEKVIETVDSIRMDERTA